jgi:tRNA(Leu) C34 or U34 (ribose-2'-O)-methylase TrmL
VNKLTKDISKTALGAEEYLDLEYSSDIFARIEKLKADDYSIISLEQSKNSIDINDFIPPNRCILVIGNELDGVDKNILNISDTIIEIPMIGKKESLNVASATAIALHVIRYK